MLIVISQVTIINIAKAGDGNVAKGWDAFKNNRLDEAVGFFKSAIKNNEAKDEANLGLSLTYWMQSKDEEAFKNFMEFFKTSPNPYPYAYALWTSSCVFDGYGKKSKEQLQLINTIINDKKANGTIKAMAQSMLAYHYENIGDFKKANEEFDKLGTIDNWQIVGTFENISASGFNKDFKALTNPKPDYKFKLKTGAEINWINVKNDRNDKWFDFSYHMIYHNSIMYAQAFVMSDKDQDVILHAGVSGSLKLWLNDVLLITESEEHNTDLDLFAVKTKLHKGANRLLVQVGESEADRANFMVRLSDRDGNFFTNLTSNVGYADYTKDADYKAEVVPFFAEQFFIDRLKNDPNNFIDLIMLAQTYSRNDKTFADRQTLNKVRALAPLSTYVGEKLINAYDKDNNTTGFTAEQEKIKSVDPDSYYALAVKYNEAIKKEDYDGADVLIDKAISIYGHNEDLDLKKINIVASKKNYDLLFKMINEMYKKYPESYSMMANKYLVESAGSKELSKGNVVLKDYLKVKYSDKVLTTLADNYFKLGKTDEGIKIYLDRVETHPYSISKYDDVANLYFAKQDYKTALKWQQFTVDKAPFHGYYYEKMGKIYGALNKNDDAMTAYKKAIYYEPTSYDARKQLALLEGKKDLFENFKTEDVYAMFQSSPNKADYPDDNSIILLNDKKRIVFPEGATEEQDEILVKILDKSAIETWKEYTVAYNSYIQRFIPDKAEVLKANGSKVQAEKNENQFVFTSLEAGDAIHLSYKIEDYQTGQMALQFWDDFTFQYFIPSLNSRYSIMTAKDKTFKYNVNNAKIEPVIEDVDGFKKYTWESKNNPSIKSETCMPPLSEIAPRLELSSIPDWQFVANWYSDLASTKAKSDFEVQEEVTNLFKDKDKSKMSDIAKAKIIYNYIESNMSYSDVAFMHGALVPQKASRTINTKLGDCKDLSTLFVAMAKEVNLKANLVLVSTRNNGEGVMNLPSIDFNHCIVQLQADNKPYFIELTDPKLSFACIPSYLKNSTCLVIPQEGDKFTSTISKIDNKIRAVNGSSRESKVSFSGNDIVVDRHNIKFGETARSTRGVYADIGKDKQLEEMTQSISPDYTTAIKLNSLTFSDLKSLSDSISYAYNFTVKNAVTDFSGIRLFQLPWSDKQNFLEQFTSDKRKFPFNVWELITAESEVETITLDIPKGKTLAEQPKSVTYTCPGIVYTIVYKITPAKIVATRTMKVNKDVVAITDYMLLKEFANKVVEADTKQLGLKNAVTPQ